MLLPCADTDSICFSLAHVTYIDSLFVWFYPACGENELVVFLFGAYIDIQIGAGESRYLLTERITTFFRER